MPLKTYIGSVLIHLLFLPGMMQGAVIDVCPQCTIASPVEALESALAGDTVRINGGEYAVDNIVIEKPVVLLGLNDPVFISKSGDEIITILSDNVTVKGLTLKYVKTSYLKERSAIRVKRKKFFLIEDNTIIDCFFGIYLEHASNGAVRHNRIFGNASAEADSGNAIHAWYCEDIEITSNILQGHRDGIYFEFVHNSRITGNKSKKNKRYGLHFMFSNDDIYSDNEFINNGVGVAVMFSRRIEMHRNHFGFNWGSASYGLLLKEIFDGNILHNHFEKNTVGIYVEGSNRITYKLNTFERNGWGIKFSGGCESNVINSNNFLSNSLDLVVNASISDNIIEGNFWSDYNGYDLDRDGIGDVPHYPVRLFSYILSEVPEAIILMRSLFVELINYSEKVSPVFTPKEVKDMKPAMDRVSGSAFNLISGK